MIKVAITECDKCYAPIKFFLEPYVIPICLVCGGTHAFDLEEITTMLETSNYEIYEPRLQLN